MPELLAWLEATALAGALRGTGVWTYGLLNLGHIAGVSTLFGAVLLLDLRLLGLRRSIPLEQVARLTVLPAAIGFFVAAACGAGMISFNATEYLGNPFLLIKFPCIGLALVNALLVSRMPAWREKARREPVARERVYLAVAGAASLLFWSAALTAGRMIGYW